MAMDKLENKKLAIIGSGHIAQALVSGLISGGVINPRCITISNPSGLNLKMIRRKFGVNIIKNNLTAVARADWVFLAIKPFVVKKVLTELHNHINDKLMISLAAGVSLKLLKSYAPGSDAQFIRVMPNISIAHNEGVIDIFTARGIRSIEEATLRKVIRSLGYLLETKRENDLDTLTLVSACGPAVVSRFIEMVVNYGVNAGFSQRTAREVALQTFMGTLAYLHKSKRSPSAMTQMVATKGGVTEAILGKLEEGGFDKMFETAMDIGKDRIEKSKRMLMRVTTNRSCEFSIMRKSARF